ncbi:hypothetical protein L6452_18906 [Arctium lappa]|uniref:Uncharacterized protein n=1 Tax=Arctium lappa TaxID=4217 RepID=A0ACB9BBL2_ARCLA|nr:hypothetical protein L6452_18906 [Arctium lappa]
MNPPTPQKPYIPSLQSSPPSDHRYSRRLHRTIATVGASIPLLQSSPPSDHRYSRRLHRSPSTTTLQPCSDVSRPVVSSTSSLNSLSLIILYSIKWGFGRDFNLLSFASYVPVAYDKSLFVSSWKSRCDVTAWNRTKSKCDPLIDLGAK